MKPTRHSFLRPAALVTVITVFAAASASAAIYQWDGGAVTGDWQTPANWNPDADNTTDGTSTTDRLNVNGAQALIYTAAEGTTVYANTTNGLPNPARGLVIGSVTSGTMTITGGTFSTAGSAAADLIGNGTATGTLTINGGNYISGTPGTALGVGSGTCILNVQSGTATITTLNNHTSGTSTISLTGSGTLEVDKITTTLTSGTNTINLDGGTLKAGAGASGPFMSGLTKAYVMSNGAKIDSNGKSITTSQNLLDFTTPSGGGLTLNDTAVTKGTLTLTGANTYTGATTVSAGTLALGNSLAMQNSAFDTSGAGTLDTSGVTTPTFGGLIGDASTGQNLAMNASVTSLTLNPGTGVTQTYVKNLTGGTAMQLTKTGAGTQVLSGANSYSGLTTVSTGVLNVQNASALGTTAAGTVVNGTTTSNASNARLELEGGITVTGEALTIKGTGNFDGALNSKSGINEWAGNLTIGLAGTRMGAKNGATLKMSGVIDSGAVNTGLTIRNEGATGTVILSGANTYLGDTSLIFGRLQLDGGDNRLPVATKLIMGNAANVHEFDLNGRNQELAGISLFGGVTASAVSVNNSSGTASTLTINTAAASPSSFAGILKGNLSLTKTGADTLTLSGPNTYTGATAVNAGTLVLTGSTDAASVVTVGGATATGSPTLSGTGTVNGTLTIAGTGAAGAVNPATAGTTGILNAGATTIAGTYACDVISAAADTLAVTGNLDLTGAKFALTSVTPTPGTYTIATYTGSRTGTFTPTPALPAGTSLDYATTGEIKLVIAAASGYGSWATTNSVLEGENGDDDKDGVINLVEYALGLNPKVGNPAPGTFTGNTLTFTKGTEAKAALDVTYKIQTSTTLATGSWMDAAATDTTDNISFLLPSNQPGGKLFGRLQVTKP